MSPRFSRHVGVDYSGAGVPTASLGGLRVYMARHDSAPVEVEPPPSPRKYWTRKGIAEWLVGLLGRDEPTLVGIDHGFSFPRQYFEQHGLAQEWPSFLDDFCRHWPTGEDYIYVDFVRNGAHGNGAARGGKARWRRIVEVWAGAKSVFHFDVPGSVAKSTHAGLPWLRYLRQRVGHRVHFWPFDGWVIPSGRSAIVEVYPSIWRGLFPIEGRTEDQHDAYSASEWMRQVDLDGRLEVFLNPPLGAEERETAAFEGWILGVMEKGRSARPLTGPAAGAVDRRGVAPAHSMVSESQELDSFPPGVAAELKTYVYRLIDPRNGETFYVGKGKGDRVFSHIRLERNLEGDDVDNKVRRIRDIQRAGFEVAHVIHRHGMDDETAYEVEGALIDAYPGLTNLAGGAGNAEYGAMHARSIVARYAAEPATFLHRALLISVNVTAPEAPLYEAVRYAWRLNRAKAEQAEVILATRQGVIKGAFVAERWLDATSTNFPGREDMPGRFGFVGREAAADMKTLYVGKSVPDEFRKKGAANPVKYTW